MRSAISSQNLLIPNRNYLNLASGIRNLESPALFNLLVLIHIDVFRVDHFIFLLPGILLRSGA